MSSSDSPESASESALLQTAVACIKPQDGSSRWYLSCEHASNRLPEASSWPADDDWLRRTHWAYDPGAAELCRELASAVGAGAVLARFSRLWIDPNRPLDSATLIRREAEGRPVGFNQGAIDRKKRVAFWAAYHNTLNAELRQSRAEVLFAIHSFNQQYEGQIRDFEIGVLFDDEEALGRALATHLQASGMTVRLNEPYSGKQGMIYAASRHAAQHGRRALEIEVRNDCCVDAGYREQLVLSLVKFMREAVLG